MTITEEELEELEELEEPPQEHVDWLNQRGFSRNGTIWWHEDLKIQISFRLYPRRWQSIYMESMGLIQFTANSPAESLNGAVKKILEMVSICEKRTKDDKMAAYGIKSMIDGSKTKPRHSYIARFDMDKEKNKSYVIRTRKAGMPLGDHQVTSAFLYFKADSKGEAEAIVKEALERWKGESGNLVYVNAKLRGE